MRVVIVGCGQVGSALAYQFYTKGHQVTVIDQDQSAFDNLPIGEDLNEHPAQQGISSLIIPGSK